MVEMREVKLPNDIEMWGYIPHMISPANADPLWRQIHDNYGHGGGWRTQEGWTFEERDGMMYGKYPGDPEKAALDSLTIGDETLYLFPHAYVLWVRGDNMKMARID